MGRTLSFLLQAHFTQAEGSHQMNSFMPDNIGSCVNRMMVIARDLVATSAVTAR
jgi:hypothetical protein